MCGIAGFISRKRKPFDYTGFCTLGIANDARGGDSCGIYIDGLNQYGVDGNKLFSMFFQLNNSLKSIKTSSVALVHCRKASIGVINEATAQPVVIRDKKGMTTFVLMHNGTIHNYEDLAKKYIPNVDIKDMTDSQVMARIFYNTGYGVLNEYNGSAVFAIVDYRHRQPRVLLWKGASKKLIASEKKEEERPLYYCYDNDQLIFSSVAIQLMAIRKNSVVRSLKPNVLWEYKNNRLMPAGSYNRENVIQGKYYATNTSNFGNKNYNSYNYDDSYYFTGNYWNNKGNKSNKADTTIHAPVAKRPNYIMFSMYDNMYRMDCEPVHGGYKCNPFGVVVPMESQTADARVFYFFRGHLLYSNRCFVFLEWLKRKSQMDYNEFEKAFGNVIGFLSAQQVFVDNKGKYMLATTPTTCRDFTGFIYPPVTSTIVSIQAGIRISSSFNRASDADSVFDDIPNFCFKSIKKQSLELLENLTV